MLVPPLVVRIRFIRGRAAALSKARPDGGRESGRLNARPGAGRRKVLGLWLPVVLLWPVIGALAALAFAAALPVGVLLRRSGLGEVVLRSVPCLLRLFVAARGLEVDVADGDREILVRFS